MTPPFSTSLMCPPCDILPSALTRLQDRMSPSPCSACIFSLSCYHYKIIYKLVLFYVCHLSPYNLNGHFYKGKCLCFPSLMYPNHLEEYRWLVDATHTFIAYLNKKQLHKNMSSNYTK